MKLASIELINDVVKHPNADSLDIVGVLGYIAIVRRDTYKVGDKIVFIQPDTVLPDAPWAAVYKAKSNRVKAVKLRGEWSMGIVESIENVFRGFIEASEGTEVSDILGVTKYDPPAPTDNSARGLLRFGLPKTDEERYQNLKPEQLPFGELVDVTLKVDGQSLTVFAKLDPITGEIENGITGRTLEFKDTADNNYTRNIKKLNVIEKLNAFARKNNVSIALRGESYGSGIQHFGINPHAKKSVGLAFYSVYLIDEHRYARKGDRFYFTTVCDELGLPTVDILEANVTLTPELILKYDNGIEKIDGNYFEGVVINHRKDSFKVISKIYDSKK